MSLFLFLFLFSYVRAIGLTRCVLVTGMRFFDDNTHSHWTPVTGGANVPALNDLLKPFGFAFGDRILNGAATMNGQAVAIASGANIARAPAGFLSRVRQPSACKEVVLGMCVAGPASQTTLTTVRCPLAKRNW